MAGAVELEVAVVGAARDLDEASARTPAAARWPTPRSSASRRSGELVLLNTTALEAGLGTGGYAFVVAVPHRPPGRPRRCRPGTSSRRATRPQQVMVLGVDEQGSPHHELLRDADDLFGMPVVVADLHSSLPAVLAGVRARPGPGRGSRT